jgi:hypothetical protein
MEKAAMKKRSRRIPSRTVCIAGVVAVVVATFAVWLLNRPTATVATPVESHPAEVPDRPSVEAKAEAKLKATAAPVELPFGMPSLAMHNQSTDIEPRKVQLALEGNGSAEDAREAAKILSICKGANAALDFAYKMRDQGDTTWRELQKRTGVSAEKYIEASEDTMRRCQVFDTATLARRGELLKRAYDGGAPDAALDYLLWLNAENKQAVDPELLGKVQRDLRRDAEDGNFEALVALSQTFDPKLGASLVQRQAYKEARFRILAETAGTAAAMESRNAMENFERATSRWSPPPRALSAEDQREAEALTQRVVDAWRKHQPSGG